MVVWVVEDERFDQLCQVEASIRCVLDSAPSLVFIL